MTRLLLPALSLSLLLAGCAREAAVPPPPVPEVSVIAARTDDVRITTELPGRINPVRDAEVRARATGIVLKRNFEEGATVQEGDLLFLIDPAPMEAALNSAKAAAARTEAALKQARATMERYQQLVEINAVSRQVFDEAEANLAQLEAELLANQAAIETAELNLGYTRVNAPITGRIGRALVTEGALVSAVEATQMAVIRQMDPVYLDITQSSLEVLRLRQALQEGKVNRNPAEKAEITLLLEDGTRYPHPGKLLFTDVSVDPSTAMVTLRAAVPNPDNVLLPGMFARAELAQGVMNDVVVIPQRTIARGPAGSATVLVVTSDNKVELRPIEINREIGNRVIVANGLKPGEQVIVEGSQKAPPGSTVRTVSFLAQAQKQN